MRRGRRTWDGRLTSCPRPLGVFRVGWLVTTCKKVTMRVFSMWRVLSVSRWRRRVVIGWTLRLDAVARLGHGQAPLVTEQLPFQAVVFRLQGAYFLPVSIGNNRKKNKSNINKQTSMTIWTRPTTANCRTCYFLWPHYDLMDERNNVDWLLHSLIIVPPLLDKNRLFVCSEKKLFLWQTSSTCSFYFQFKSKEGKRRGKWRTSFGSCGCVRRRRICGKLPGTAKVSRPTPPEPAVAACRWRSRWPSSTTAVEQNRQQCSHITLVHRGFHVHDFSNQLAIFSASVTLNLIQHSRAVSSPEDRLSIQGNDNNHFLLLVFDEDLKSWPISVYRQSRPAPGQRIELDGQ